MWSMFSSNQLDHICRFCNQGKFIINFALLLAKLVLLVQLHVEHVSDLHFINCKICCAHTFPFNLEKWFEGYPVKSTHIFCRVSAWKKLGVKKSGRWYLKKSQVAPYKKWSQNSRSLEPHKQFQTIQNLHIQMIFSFLWLCQIRE